MTSARPLPAYRLAWASPAGRWGRPLRPYRFGRALLGAAAAVFIGCAAGPGGAVEPTFDAWWHDGRAELDGYHLVESRYGAPRRAQAVMVFVTEPFSASRHVKLDDPSKHPGDLVDVLKLNLVRDFQTGIYDYNTMASLFVRTADFEPVKLSFSSAEWCGHVYEELNFAAHSVARQTFSYFEGESGGATVARPTGGIVEDALYVLVRGLRGPWLKPGERRRLPFLSSPFVRRLSHQPMSWGTATVSRRARGAHVSVPAGTFEADVYDVATSDGRTGRFEVERAYPHRIVRWRWSRPMGGDRDRFLGAIETGELSGTLRARYWELNRPGDERYLQALGLEPTVR